MGIASLFSDSGTGVARLLGRAALIALVTCTWPSGVGADQDDPRLPELFESLQAADDPQQGDRIGRRIAEIWNQHDDQGVSEIMRQGRALVAQGQLKLALGNFTTVTTMEPGYAEGWNKRASVLYSMGRLDDAARSIAEVLAREPRHFLAIAGLGLIYLQLGDLEEALRAFEYALNINPHLAGTRMAAEEIRRRLGH
jgi:tetratricopeptide (TPR) repeat protein